MVSDFKSRRDNDGVICFQKEFDLFKIYIGKYKVSSGATDVCSIEGDKYYAWNNIPRYMNFLEMKEVLDIFRFTLNFDNGIYFTNVKYRLNWMILCLWDFKTPADPWELSIYKNQGLINDTLFEINYMIYSGSSIQTNINHEALSENDYDRGKVSEKEIKIYYEDSLIVKITAPVNLIDDIKVENAYIEIQYSNNPLSNTLFEFYRSKIECRKMNLEPYEFVLPTKEEKLINNRGDAVTLIY